MLFDAHNHAFAVFGGVPQRGIYDNMNSARYASSAGSVNNVTNPAAAGARVQWDSGIMEYGPLAAYQTLQVPPPLVMVGWRTSSYNYMSIGQQWIQAIALRNQ